ncbi:MAG: hypothetical protein C0505_01330 [Leptothrix sp. (in: Bacteria)]|nr:hypothetical protein [Leptothrix sp. (in: b-proteobacteria)]
MLGRPFTRNRITAAMLLARAAQSSELSPAEREACLSLVDELELRNDEASFANAFNKAAAF